VSRSIAAALESWLAEGHDRIGEIRILKNGDAKVGYVLLHHADFERASALRVFTDPTDARGIALYDAAGEYRPLKTAPNLIRGWELHLPDTAALLAALDFFYPAMAGTWLAFQQKKLHAVPFRETAARQSGMYDIVKKITDDQAQELIGAFCRSDGKCLKTILWNIDGRTPLTHLPASKFDPAAGQCGSGGPSAAGGRAIPMLCNEACNLLVAAARGVVRKARGKE